MSADDTPYVDFDFIKSLYVSGKFETIVNIPESKFKFGARLLDPEAFCKCPDLIRFVKNPDRGVIYSVVAAKPSLYKYCLDNFDLGLAISRIAVSADPFNLIFAPKEHLEFYNGDLVAKLWCELLGKIDCSRTLIVALVRIPSDILSRPSIQVIALESFMKYSSENKIFDWVECYILKKGVTVTNELRYAALGYGVDL